MSTFNVSSTHDFLRLKTQISQNIKKLQQTPQQFNALATRIKNGESNTMQDVKALVDSTREKTNHTQSLFKIFSDQASDRYVTNKAQKRQDTNTFKSQIERALKDIENAERHVINTEKEALKEYRKIDMTKITLGSRLDRIKVLIEILLSFYWVLLSIYWFFIGYYG